MSNDSTTNKTWNQQRYRNTNNIASEYHNYIANYNANTNHHQSSNNKPKNLNNGHCYSNLSASRSEYRRNDKYYNRTSAAHIKNDNNSYCKRSADKYFSDFTNNSLNGPNNGVTTSSDVGAADNDSLKRRPSYYHTFSSTHSSLLNSKNKACNLQQSHGVLTNYNERFVRDHQSSSILNASTVCDENALEKTQNLTDGCLKRQEKEIKSFTQLEQQQHHFNEGKFLSHSYYMNNTLISRKKALVSCLTSR